ncbi:glycine--tRNA ligase [Candidatus Woesearchaeota archaeon]|nr:glycine--tRNA ligase [Candidatus Woesearchaeota archaeon]
MTPQERLKELQSYLQDRGFVYGPAPEIYGGLAGFYDYGPLGKALKNNVENTIRKVFTQNAFFEVECPTVLPKEVWEASGHLGGFTDPIIKDKKGNTYRVDNLIEEFAHNNNIEIKVEGKTHDELLGLLKEHNIKSPSGEEFIPEIKTHNLMMQTTIGLDREAYNRPETATTTYLPFLRYLNFFRDKLPFGIFQIGKAYRNEISPRQFLIRMREFTQAEAQLVIFKEQKQDFEAFAKVQDDILPFYPAKTDTLTQVTLNEAVTQGMLKNKAYAWTLALVYKTFLSIGILPEAMRLRQHHPDELAFYADDAWDLEINLPSFGWTEICGIHDRKDYDLTQHSKFSKTDLIAPKPEGGKETPHVLEIAFGTDRPTFALLDLFYEQKDKEEGKTTLALPYHMAPIPVCVFPLVNKLHEQAYEIFSQVQKDFMALYDKSGSVGKRYLRADSMGVAFCVTYDFDTLEQDQKVTVRDRDTGMQKRVAITQLNQTLKQLLAGEIALAELK